MGITSRKFVLDSFLVLAYWLEMPEPPVRLTPADPNDLAYALAFALRFDGRRGKGDAAEFMADIVAKRLVRHLERAGFVVMKRPPGVGGAAIGRGFEG